MFVCLLLKFGSQGTADGKFNYPWGCTTDALGFIYVCDKENHRIQVRFMMIVLMLITRQGFYHLMKLQTSFSGLSIGWYICW